jgi:hypothetical protein
MLIGAREAVGNSLCSFGKNAPAFDLFTLAQFQLFEAHTLTKSNQ